MYHLIREPSVLVEGKREGSSSPESPSRRVVLAETRNQADHDVSERGIKQTMMSAEVEAGTLHMRDVFF